MVDAFFLETPKDNRKKALAVDPAKGKTEKSSIFHRTVEMKQPHTITEPLGKVSPSITTFPFV